MAEDRTMDDFDWEKITGDLNDIINMAVDRYMMRNKSVVMGKAVNVTDITCDLDRGEDLPPIKKVRLSANEEGSASYQVTVPKEGSYVLAAMIEGRQLKHCLVMCSEVQKIIWKCGEATTLLFEDGNTVFNGGSNGGVPIVGKVGINLSTIKTYVDALYNATHAALSLVDGTAGSASAGPFELAMSAFNMDFEDMENTKVKH